MGNQFSFYFSGSKGVEPTGNVVEVTVIGNPVIGNNVK